MNSHVRAAFCFFAILFIAAVCSVSHANALFEMGGSGAAVTMGDSPKMYQSVLRIGLADQSSIEKGTFLVYGNGTFLHASIIPKTWTFSYGKDGSFHGHGTVETTTDGPYNMTVDGKRIFATAESSLWRVTADMQGSNADLILSYFVTGQDPVPTVDLSQNATIIIPNGNSAIASQGFYMPLNLEVMRGTTVTWHNEDNIDHYLQSQDGHGNITPLFNSGILHTGDTFSYKFTKPGTYYYFCTIHPWRTGVVTVS